MGTSAHTKYNLFFFNGKHIKDIHMGKKKGTNRNYKGIKREKNVETTSKSIPLQLDL